MPVLHIGVLGGTFDPIHLGHLGAADAVRVARSLDLVVFVPTGRPWHRGEAPQASAEDRLAMVEAALADRPEFLVSRVDVDRDGPTYTVDTLRDLRQWFAGAYPQDAADWTLITGADALMQMHEWRAPQEIAQLAHIVGVTRPGHAIGTPLGLPAGSWSRVEIPGIDVSATEVRRRVARGEAIADLVPAPVVQYIAEHGLYRSGGG